MKPITTTIVLTSLLSLGLFGTPVHSDDGFVGIYSDSLATTSCASVPPYTSRIFYVLAKTAGSSSGGITGAEFRIEVTNPEGWYISYNGPTTASVVLGDPLDTEPGPNPAGGVNVGFPSCQLSTDGSVKLGTLTVFNGGGGPTMLVVRRHSRPSNVTFACPLFVVCDEPVYSKVCMTSATPDTCTLGSQKAVRTVADDPAVFTASLNEGEAIDLPRDPTREALVVFKNGVAELPSGSIHATVAATTINSQSVQEALESNNTVAIAKTFPNWDPADTLGVARTGETVRLTNYSNYFILTVQDSSDVGLLIEELSLLSEVVLAERNATGTLQVEPTRKLDSTASLCAPDQEFPDQWHLHGTNAINVCPAWERTHGQSTSLIGIIDSGVDRAHQDLTGKVSGDVLLTNPHGTKVAGIAAALGGNLCMVGGELVPCGTVGVDWQAHIFSKHVGTQVTSDEAAAAIRDCYNAHTDVINMSFGIDVSDDTDHMLFPLRDSYMLNCLAVAGSGNDATNGNPILYPGGYGNTAQGIITVGATNRDGSRRPTSSFGSQLDVVAPGEDILSTAPGNAYISESGTSMAAPQVAGLATLLLAMNPTLYNDDIERIIRLTADHPLGLDWDPEYGTGRINAGNAVARLVSPYALYAWEADGGSDYSSTGLITYWKFYVPPPGYEAGIYWVKRHEVRREVSFPVTFASVPDVWGRGVATVGYTKATQNYNTGFCEPVPGTVTVSGCVLTTYVYEVWEQAGPFRGWWPTTPSGVHFAYSVNGIPLGGVSDVSSSVSAGRVNLHVPNPLKSGDSISLAMPSACPAVLEVFSVSGQRARRVNVEARGKFELLRWDGRDDSGRNLSSGVYLIRATTAHGVARAKAVIVR